MIKENILLALSAIRANKMRSFLTMLGMIIGIFSVISIVSLGDTMRGAFISEYEAIGTGYAYLYIMPEEDYYTEDDLFSKDDRDDLLYAMGDDLLYAGFGVSDRIDIKVGRKQESVYLTGVGTNATAQYDPKILYGRMISDEDALHQRNYVVLEKSTAMALFGKENAVGETFSITLNNELQELMVVGVYENDDSAFMKLMSGGQPQNAYVTEEIMVPQEGATQFQMEVVFNEDHNMEQSKQKLINYISRMKNCTADQVRVYSAMDEMDQVDSLLGGLSAVLGAIAAISLLVGGIGIMNIMLVSVTERTREIGIRKALGACTSDILVQFLVESAIISVLGGTLGMVLGIGIVSGAGAIIGIQAVVKSSVVILAVAFSALVGVGFGLYPALKAAKKDPVEALRYE